MLRDKDIICISSIDWDFLWQGHQEIMTRLARNGNRVLFIENTGVRTPGIRDLGRIRKRIVNWRRGVHGIRKMEERLYVYSPLVLPFPYLRIARFINKRLIFSTLFRWLKAVGFSEPIVWVFLPTGLSIDLIEKIEPKVLIYYCIDSFQASSKDARKIKKTEALLLKKADLVFTTSEELYTYCSKYSNRVHYFPFGVNIENFTNIADKKRNTPDDIKAIKKPIAGYVGGIHKWVDFDIIRHAASKNIDISFVFCGPIQTDIKKMKDLHNVFFLGQKRMEELPLYVKEFDIAMIPYRITEYTKNVYPTKLNEYLSMGKEVISTDLPEIRRFNIENDNVVRVSLTPDEFSDKIRDAVNKPIDERMTELAVKAAKKNSWSVRMENMSFLIECIEREKAVQREVLWKNNLIRFYRTTKAKFVPALTALALICALFFYTPLVWLLARPLYIKDIPGKADVIVALGGGVGESGKVSQGYQERVDTAVRLYKRHLSYNILYSSGYRYLMKEAGVMKALSISMGVRAEDILIDDTAVNTYEMIMHLKDVVEKNGWKSVMIVSSPYHMLRLKFLCDRYLKGTNVLYIPVEESEYYARGSVVKARQIEGIAKEYLAILYYKVKGYV